MDFFVTDLGQDQIVLGYLFLWIFNPTINWSNGGINRLSQITITPTKLWKHCQQVWEKDKKICIHKTHFAQRGPQMQTRGRRNFLKKTFHNDLSNIGECFPRSKQKGYHQPEKKTCISFLKKTHHNSWTVRSTH